MPGLKHDSGQQPQGFVVVAIYSYSQGSQQSLQLCKHGSKMLEILILPVFSPVCELLYHLSVQCTFSISMVTNYRKDPLCFYPTLLHFVSQIDRPVDDIEEKEGEGEEGSCIEVNAFCSSGYDRFGWWGFLVGFILGLEGPCHFNRFTITVKVGKFKVSR